MNKDKIYSVPTNIVTGFLGVGKTSAILHLLKQKPAMERWAVLVNEFGEIGVDGSLIKGQTAHNKDIFIQEVSGGCMCCASKLPMQIALNQLLSKSKPHRLLIEPTGLGHPIEVLQVLSNQYYKDILSLEKITTLVDARNLADKKYTDHLVFNQQLLVADIIIGSKCDLYGPNDKQALIDYISTQPTKPENITFIEHGQLPLDLLAGQTQYDLQPIHHQHNHKVSTPNNAEPVLNSGFIKATGEGEGFQSIGWRFTPEKIFDRIKLHAFITRINVTRLKAVFITSEGIYGYNTVDNNIVEIELDECRESRIEIICKQVNDTWENELISLFNE